MGGVQRACRVEKRDDGLEWLVPVSAWDESCRTTFQRRSIEALELNYARGFAGDLSCLADVKDALRRLTVIDRSIVDLRPVAALHLLTHLDLQVSHEVSALDLVSLRRLVSLAVSDVPGLRSAFECSALQDLFVDDYGREDLRPLRGLSELRSLDVANARSLTTLDGVERLTALRALTVRGATRLREVDGIVHLPLLERLTISGCRRLESLAGLREAPLRRLVLANSGSAPLIGHLDGARATLTEAYFEGRKLSPAEQTYLGEFPKLKRVVAARA